MSAIASILVGVASKVGAPLVKGLLEKHAGPLAGSIAGTVIETVARHAGAAPEALPSLPPPVLEAAVAMAETDMVALQREANALFALEHGEKTAFAWGWRPGMMWLIGFLWLWSIVLVPVANAIVGAAMPLYLAELTALTITYTGLYMGGHTIKAWKGAT